MSGWGSASGRALPERERIPNRFGFICGSIACAQAEQTPAKVERVAVIVADLVEALASHGQHENEAGTSRQAVKAIAPRQFARVRYQPPTIASLSWA